MAAQALRFGRFVLEPDNRRLVADGAPVEINARYLDALILLAGQPGQLVSKDRFMGEVWRGVPVTDEALTQCIRTLRRHLEDDASNPRFIETVPRHGYRFIAEVTAAGQAPEDPSQGPAAPLPRPQPSGALHDALLLAGAGVLGAGAAGAAGGLLYGLAGASQAIEAGVGAISVLLVLLALTLFAAVTGGLGVSLGIAAGTLRSGRIGWWCVAGGALGGLLVGGMAKLLGLDAFSLLFGRSPGDITGAPEGFVLGGATGLGLLAAARMGDMASLPRALVAGAAAGVLAGVLIRLAGGRMMGGSLQLLAASFPGSRLRLDQIGMLSGEDGVGPTVQYLTNALEGGLFGACIVGAMLLARRSGGRQTRG